MKIMNHVFKLTVVPAYGRHRELLLVTVAPGVPKLQERNFTLELMALAERREADWAMLWDCDVRVERRPLWAAMAGAVRSWFRRRKTVGQKGMRTG